MKGGDFEGIIWGWLVGKRWGFIRLYGTSGVLVPMCAEWTRLLSFQLE